MNPSRPHRGFTLTEMAIVLGVVGIVLGGIWAASSSVNDKQKANKAAQEVAIITQNMRSVLFGEELIPGWDFDRLCNGGRPLPTGHDREWRHRKPVGNGQCSSWLLWSF